METSALHNQVNVFSQEDNCLYFALGLAHAAHELGEHLLVSLPRERGQNGPAPTPGSLSGTSQGSGVPDDLQHDQDDLLYLLLGVISFSRHYQELLDRFDAAQPAAETLQSASSLPRLSDDLPRPLIRQMLR